MEVQVIVTNWYFHHVSKPSTDQLITGRKIKTLLANTAFLYKSRKRINYILFFFLMLTFLKIPLVSCQIFKRKAVRIRVNWYDRPWENKTNKKPFCSALHRAVTRTRKTSLWSPVCIPFLTRGKRMEVFGFYDNPDGP